jgi:hypothetical protein|tara:strand:+ start:94 stop:579 length:486 start_codon:yes stop_codon:yes gene_type:complete
MRADYINQNSGRSDFQAKVVNLDPSSDGDVSTYTKELSVAESGSIFVCNIADYDCTVKLPAVANAGANYKFILSYASNNEASKNLVVTANAAGEDIVGNIMVAGAVVEVTGNSSIEIDSSAGAATYGDWLSFVSDGSYWYIDGSTVTASSVVQAAGIAMTS